MPGHARRHIGKWSALGMYWIAQALVVFVIATLWRSQGDTVKAETPAGRFDIDEILGVATDPQYIFDVAGVLVVASVLQGLFLLPVRRPSAAAARGSWLWVSLAIAGALIALMVGAVVLVVADAAWLVLGERVRRATWFSMVFAIAGVGVMVGGGIGAGALLGNLTALLSVFGFAGFAVAMRWGRQTDMLALVCLAGVFTAIVAGFMADSYAYSPRDLGIIAVMGVIQVSAGMILFTMGSRHVPATELTLLALTEVVLGPIWVWLWLGEVPRLWTLVGGAVVFAAIIGHAVTGMRHKPAPLGTA